MFMGGSVSASWRKTSLCFPCSVCSSGLSFQQECFLAGLLSNYSIASFMKSWNSLMNSTWSYLRLASDELSSSLSWPLAWSAGDLFFTSCCHTLPVRLLDSPVTSHLSVDRCHRTCSCVLGGIYSIVLFSVTVSVMSRTFCVSGVFPVGFPTVSLSPSDADDSSSASCSQFLVMFLHTGIHFVILFIWFLWHALVACFNVYHSYLSVFREYNL